MLCYDIIMMTLEQNWSVEFPKVGLDDVEPSIFFKNVRKEVDLFLGGRFPCTFSDWGDGSVILNFNDWASESVNVFEKYYPEIFIGSTITGLAKNVEGFKHSMNNKFVLAFRGSFLRNVTTGKFVGIKLTGLYFTIKKAVVSSSAMDIFSEIDIL